MGTSLLSFCHVLKFPSMDTLSYDDLLYLCIDVTEALTVASVIY